ncbi:MAG: peptidase M23 [Deltaproteobacteria bacterium]|jgi:murein DD-endopeptidase MepM/ murein hydrolase activator NlpD|nr:peptidase M23 [Deltaproteobacteria bacterium]
MNLSEKRRAGPALALALVLAALLLSACTRQSEPVAGAPAPRDEAVATLPAGPAPVAAPERALHVVEGKLGRGETLSSALRSRDVDWLVIHQIDAGMLPVFNFRYSRPGDRFRVGLDSDGALVHFDYERSRLERYVLRADEGEYRAERIEPDIEVRRARLAGVVDGSLYEAVGSLGEATELASDFAEIFAWDVDFSRGVQRGDEFSMLYEQRYLLGDAESEFYIGPGRILAARYSNASQDYRAVVYAAAEGEEGYYRPDGSSVERQFLRAPLKYRRISSRYSANRLHPILKVRRPHFGIDYAAPRGTPVWSVADGTVVFRGVQGGFGKLVKVRHTNGYVTYYGHLSRFAQTLRVGDKIQQKQVIGYVGSTGLSTGPHLDFRLKQYGRYVNPASLRTPPAKPIPSDQMDRFAVIRDGLFRELEPGPVMAATSEAM